MLLTSQRHTPADLALWAALEEADRIHGARLAQGPRPAKAIAAMHAFIAAGPCYLSVSWGKDSVVLAHLAAAAGICIPVVNINQTGPQHDPEVHRVRDAFLSRYPVEYHEIEVAPPERQQTDSGHAPALDIGIRIAQERFGTRRYIGGIRADESGVRKIALRRGSANSCQPIAWWSPQDVFGWLAYHDLPVHPAYAMLGGGRYDRRHIRVSILGGAKGRQFDRDAWEREFYSDILKRLASEAYNERVANEQ